MNGDSIKQLRSVVVTALAPSLVNVCHLGEDHLHLLVTLFLFKKSSSLAVGHLHSHQPARVHLTGDVLQDDSARRRQHHLPHEGAKLRGAALPVLLLVRAVDDDAAAEEEPHRGLLRGEAAQLKVRKEVVRLDAVAAHADVPRRTEGLRVGGGGGVGGEGADGGGAVAAVALRLHCDLLLLEKGNSGWGGGRRWQDLR
ncbi:hypothetical protein TYRP_011041 [Tyrophagus putrescentiae]|nr:hypothetical protein TYRP_011041 [Tyrophagus putrescentiae]